MKAYKVEQYSRKEWDSKFETMYALGEFEDAEDTIQIVWDDGKVSMDIMANGKRLVPILRKVEKAMTDAGLAGKEGIYAGWFGEWANVLADPRDKKYFDWHYTGKYDMENNNWSYSWGIEQIDGDRWYIYLNLATASTGLEFAHNHIWATSNERKG